ncbi:hypothetical protein MACH10_00130 [Thalassospira tepidiphila]|uniref:DUF4194 domain-containing protein n=1 Tax=Thalassospira tepidiphila TaxID=393657 RepID=UPI002922ADAC|nr:hypothetical protein MACH10_00130 [Thalassospira tepidiphila]
MITDFSELEHRDEKRFAEVRQAINTLWRHQIVWLGDHGSHLAYQSLTDPRHKGLLDKFFDIAGCHLQINSVQQWVAIFPDCDSAEGISWPKLPLHTTIALLVLAVLHHEKMEAGEFDERGVVCTTFNECMERYEDIVDQNGTAKLQAKRFEDALQDLAKRHVIKLGDYISELEDYEVLIRPVLTHLTGQAALEKLQQYANSRESAEEQKPICDPEVMSVGEGETDAQEISQ